MLSNPELILFAIQSAVKLGGQIRKAYVDNLKSKKLILPLPQFPSQSDWTSALNYFEDKGKRHLQRMPRIAELLSKAQSQTINDDEKNEFTLFHQEMKAFDYAEEDIFIGEGVFSLEIEALVTVRQWRRGNDPNPTALKRGAGGLIEIAVDYFANMPGALNEKSAYSKVLKGFFSAIDDKDFINTPVEEIAENLFVAVIESIGENSGLLTGDAKIQTMVESVAKGIARDAKAKIEKVRSSGGNLEAEERIRMWSQLILRSVLSNAGEVALANPAKFLNMSEGPESAMVSSVGTAILGCILDTDDVNIENLFSRNAVDKVVKAAISVLADHPELIDEKRNGIRKIITRIAKEISVSSQLIGKDMLPEIIRLVLEKTSHNLELVWPGGSTDPAGHLLIVAAREVLDSFSQKQPGVLWKLNPTEKQIVDIVDTVFDEVIRNPGWILEKEAGTSSILKDALTGALDALNNISGDILSAETRMAVLKSAIKAVSMRRDFLEKATIGEQGRVCLITLALDGIFDIVFGKSTSLKARWVLSRGSVISIIVDSFLERLVIEGVSKENIRKAAKKIEDAVVRLSDGGRFSLAELKEELMNIRI